MPTIDLVHAVNLPPEEAIRYLKRKGMEVSWNWWEMWEAAHARAFTVAKAVQGDVLKTIRKSVDRALAEGRTYRQFAAELEPELRKLGWWGRQIVVDPDGGAERVQLGSPHRLKTIFRTNIRTAHAAAREQAQAANADSRPYWMYSARLAQV